MPAQVREELTGNRRYRLANVEQDTGGVLGLVERLVLQVEVSVWNDVAEGKDPRWICEWRDATPADLTPVEDIV